MRVFITGVAGFIGSTLAHLLLDQGHQVAGIDSLNDYYDPTLKTARLDRLMAREGFAFTEGKIETPGVLVNLFSTGYDAVVHLAAQAGVRYSIDNPRAYLEANLIGTFELLEAARTHPPKHMLLASTSSAYGANTDMPMWKPNVPIIRCRFMQQPKNQTKQWRIPMPIYLICPLLCFVFLRSMVLGGAPMWHCLNSPMQF